MEVSDLFHDLTLYPVRKEPAALNGEEASLVPDVVAKRKIPALAGNRIPVV
jgi:hypothetical protein